MATSHISVYLSSANSPTGANASILRQKEHYDNLVEYYEQKGMKREAEIFSDVVKELAFLQDQLFGKSQKQTNK